MLAIDPIEQRQNRGSCQQILNNRMHRSVGNWKSAGMEEWNNNAEVLKPPSLSSSANLFIYFRGSFSLSASINLLICFWGSFSSSSSVNLFICFWGSKIQAAKLLLCIFSLKLETITNVFFLYHISRKVGPRNNYHSCDL